MKLHSIQATVTHDFVDLRGRLIHEDTYELRLPADIRAGGFCLSNQLPGPVRGHLPLARCEDEAYEIGARVGRGDGMLGLGDAANLEPSHRQLPP